MRLVKLRGESMQAAADAQPSGMVSVIGLSADKVGAQGVVAVQVLGRVPLRPCAMRGRAADLHDAAASRPLPSSYSTPPQVAELCEAASAEVPAGQGVRIANYLCNGGCWACSLRVGRIARQLRQWSVHCFVPYGVSSSWTAGYPVGSFGSYSCIPPPSLTLSPGNYAVSGGIAGCEAVEKLAKSFKAR